MKKKKVSKKLDLPNYLIDCKRNTPEEERKLDMDIMLKLHNENRSKTIK